MVARLTFTASYLFIVALLLVSCTPGTLCSVGPFQPSTDFERRLTRAEKQQVYVWNQSGVDVCGWKAPQ